MAIDLDTLRELRIRQVRVFLSDFPYKNRLLGTEESDRDDIELALDLSVDNFNNAEVPKTSFALANFPSLRVLIYGAVIELLTMKGILYSRNRLNYSDGGIQVAVNDKAPEYTQWLNAMLRTNERLTANLKLSLNVANAWGGVPSEYATTDYWY